MDGPLPLSHEQRESALKDLVGSDRVAMVEAAKLLSSDTSTTARLLELLATEARVETRHAILHALTWHRAPETWGLMVRILEDRGEDPKVRGQAAEGLAYMFPERATGTDAFEAGVKALVDASKDPSPEVRYCAAFALGAAGHPPLAPVLKALLEDSTPVPGWVGTVGDAATRALETFDLECAKRRERGP